MGNRIRLFIILLAFVISIVHAKPDYKVESTVKVNDIIVPVIVRHELLANLLLKVTLEVADKNKVVLVKKLMPRIRDSFLEELYIALPLIWDGESSLDFDRISQTIPFTINNEYNTLNRK